MNYKYIFCLYFYFYPYLGLLRLFYSIFMSSFKLRKSRAFIQIQIWHVISYFRTSFRWVLIENSNIFYEITRDLKLNTFYWIQIVWLCWLKNKACGFSIPLLATCVCFVNMVYCSLQRVLKTTNTKITNNYILNFLLQFSSAK